jgi:hypothetical protein
MEVCWQWCQRQTRGWRAWERERKGAVDETADSEFEEEWCCGDGSGLGDTWIDGWAVIASSVLVDFDG